MKILKGGSSFSQPNTRISKSSHSKKNSKPSTKKRSKQSSKQSSKKSSRQSSLQKGRYWSLSQKLRNSLRSRNSLRQKKLLRSRISHDTLKRAHQERDRLFRLNISDYRQEVMMLNGVFKKIPKHLINKYKKININHRKIDFINLINKFNTISKKTFGTNMRTKNPKKYYYNLFLLYIIFIVMSKTFSKRKGTLGIPKTIKLEFYPDVTPFFREVDDDLTPVPEPSDKLINQHLDGMIEVLNENNATSILKM